MAPVTKGPIPLPLDLFHTNIIPHLSRQLCNNNRLVIVMVGLPARGKSYISRKLSRYLNWIGISTKVFNLGEYRRRKAETGNDHEFFEQKNREAVAVRTQCALDALNDISAWLQSVGEVAIMDGTNSTVERRKLIQNIVVNKMGYNLFFIESVCDDQKVIESNIMEAKVKSPDYVGKGKMFVFNDFIQRIVHYQEQYESLGENEESNLSFIKIYNTGETIEVHKPEGRIQTRIANFLMNINIKPRIIYLTKHGETNYDLEHRIGGDSDLTQMGKDYGSALAKYIKLQNAPDLQIWSSSLKRSMQTAAGIPIKQERWKALDDIDHGICEDMTYSEIQEKYPEQFVARGCMKLKYHYPRGESYEDVVKRLEPVIIELERQSNVLVVSDRAVLRCLLAYFLGTPLSEMPYLQIPSHTVIKLTSDVYGFKVDYINLLSNI